VMDSTRAWVPAGGAPVRGPYCGAAAVLPGEGMYAREMSEEEGEWNEGETVQLDSRVTCVVHPLRDECGAIFFTELFIALEKKKFTSPVFPGGIVKSFTEVFGEGRDIDYVHPTPRPFSDGVVLLEARSSMASIGIPLRGHARCLFECGASLGRRDERWILPRGEYRIVVCVVYKMHCAEGASMWFNASRTHYHGHV
jgi:hypothetical protein